MSRCVRKQVHQSESVKMYLKTEWFEKQAWVCCKVFKCHYGVIILFSHIHKSQHFVNHVLHQSFWRCVYLLCSCGVLSHSKWCHNWSRWRSMNVFPPCQIDRLIEQLLHDLHLYFYRTRNHECCYLSIKLLKCTLYLSLLRRHLLSLKLHPRTLTHRHTHTHPTHFPGILLFNHVKWHV